MPRLFLEGPPGSGKHARLAEHIQQLLQAGTDAYSLLVLVPDRSIRDRLQHTLSAALRGQHRMPDLHTYYSLAQGMITRFWPIIAGPAGFTESSLPPTFLTYETAQHLMSRIVTPLLEQGYFEGLSIRRQRLLSQLLDNLNKAAINGYAHTEIGHRLGAAWAGDETRRQAYLQAQICADRFRRHCLERNLLDISLTIALFHRHLVEDAIFWQYFTGRYRHLVVAHLEESVPVAQDLIRRLIPFTESTLLTYETGGGYRVFMGIDPTGAKQLADLCADQESLPAPPDTNPNIVALDLALGQRLGQVPKGPLPGDPQAALDQHIIQKRYRSEMIEAVAQEIGRLVRDEGVSPDEIAVVAPYADGVLRFVLRESFQRAGVPFRVIRRFESLREDPVVRACLTAAVLAHPAWPTPCPPPDVAEALTLIVAGLDFVRATRLAGALYAPEERHLQPAETLSAADREKIGADALDCYEVLREWLETFRSAENTIPIDLFFQQFYAEILERSGFGAADDAGYAPSVTRLIESARRFREVAPSLGEQDADIGAAYWQMVYSGVVAAQYLLDEAYGTTGSEAVTLVAPVYTYLLAGRRVRYQFWLDVGAIGWWEPPYQPLTNPYVLSRNWPAGDRWTDDFDFHIRNETLYRLVHGLCARCRNALYLCSSDLETGGNLQDSPLLRAALSVANHQRIRDDHAAH
ncbi:MAG: hypothetical protein GXP41_06750 [Chloroflexi bacterium]|nr:hypothetical protein [Chloroflexota bacterium]